MDPSARFQPATEADLDQILPLMRRYYAEDDYPFHAEEARAAALELIRNPELGRLWVARGEPGVVGYLAVTLGFSLEYRGRDAFVDELYLSESARGQGLGREALLVAEAYCREVGVKALHLEVENHRPVARELYRKAGFEDHDRRLMTKGL